jgi:hypothetical protein
VIELAGGTALVEGYRGPLIATFEQGGRQVVLVAFDMTAELFPFRLAFPLFLRNALAWFEVEEDLVLEASYRPGEAIRPLRRLLVPQVEVSWVEAGRVESRSLPVREGRFAFLETEEPRPLLVRVGARNHSTAVNLFDARESDIRPDRPDAGEGAPTDAGRSFLHRDLVPLLAALALALWALEWALYHLRVTE